jgi:hypothetical protein
LALDRRRVALCRDDDEKMIWGILMKS